MSPLRFAFMCSTIITLIFIGPGSAPAEDPPGPSTAPPLEQAEAPLLAADLSTEPRESPMADGPAYGRDLVANEESVAEQARHFDDAVASDMEVMSEEDTGACCSPYTWIPACVDDVSQDDCNNAMWAYQGDESTCDAVNNCEGRCPSECEYCWSDTIVEDNCPAEWEGDGVCDCGCQFDDPDCVLVRVVPVILNTPTPDPNNPYPGPNAPPSDPEVLARATFYYVEIWASNVAGDRPGLVCVSEDVSYPTAFLDANSPVVDGPLFPINPMPPVFDDPAGLVDDVSGCQGIPVTDFLGVGEWVMVDRIRMSCAEPTGFCVDLADANSPFVGVTLIGEFNNLEPSQVGFESACAQCVECLEDGHCDDDVGCTDDTCDPNGMVCVFTANDANCLDPNAPYFDPNAPYCDETDGCVECLENAHCDDGVGCTDDICDPNGMCVITANDANCDPNFPYCDETRDCVVCLDDSHCDDGVDCTDDTCDANGMCVFTPNDDWCVDPNFPYCDETLDCVECLDDGHCDDGVGCTDDTCDPNGMCVITANDDWCVDPNFPYCHETDGCVECLDDGHCDDGVNCTDDTCDPNGMVCVFTPNNDWCVDPNFPYCHETLDCVECLEDGHCDDDVGCTDDTCDPNGMVCVFTANDANCLDPNAPYFDPDTPYCHETDGCVECLENAHCDDGVDCTDDICDPNGRCVITANDDNCDPNSPYCDETLDCVECLDDGHCTDPNAPYCDPNGECVGCGDCPFDVNENDFVDTGDYTFFLSCFATCPPNVGDPCFCLDVNENGCIDTGDYAAFLECFGKPCPCPNGLDSPGSSGSMGGMEMRIVVSPSPKAPDYANILPAPIESVGGGETFFVHVWVSAANRRADKVACAFADLHYDSSLMTPQGVWTASRFAQFNDAWISHSNGVIHNLGGCINPDQLHLDTTGSWAHVATIDMRATGLAGTANLALTHPSGDLRRISLVGESDISGSSEVEFGEIKVRVRGLPTDTRRIEPLRPIGGIGDRQSVPAR